MQEKQLVDRIAHLEFVNDQIAAELLELDKLLRAIGFSDGVKSVKLAAKEIFQQQKNQVQEYDGEEFFE